MVHRVLLAVRELRDVQVTKLVPFIHKTQISLFADDFTVTDAAMARCVLVHYFVCLDAAVRVRVVLCSIEHGVSVGDESLLRLRVTGLITVARAISIDGRWLPHDQIDNSPAIDDSSDLFLPRAEKLTTVHGLADLPLTELLVRFLASRAQISIKDARNELA